jgi:flagellar motility protein MotE (MotC chaperone)
MKFKVLPITIAACFLLIAVKTAEVAGAFRDYEKKETSEKSEAKALAMKETASGDEAKPEEDKKEESKDEAAAGEGGGHDAKPQAKKEEPKTVHDVAPAENLPKYNDTEKEVLEKLAARRAELEAWSKELEMKEQLINASSNKLDKKLADLKTLKEQTEALLAQYKEQDDAKIRSLVKMYEAMKPASAASIFEETNEGIVLEIVDKMAEKKASLILAKMSPKKAKNITEDLAKQRSLAVATDTAKDAAKTSN